MGKSKEKEIANDVEFDTTPVADEMVKINKEDTLIVEKKDTTVSADVDKLESCLYNERIIVRHINKPGMVTNPEHVLYGGMAENATKTFCVPKLSSGAFVDVLTKKEKEFLEYALGLEQNAMSVYKKNGNFWDDSNPNGINRVSLKKQDNYFDMSKPEDYIKIKILLANKDAVAPSVQVLQDKPKASYQFVIVKESDENKLATQGMNYIMSSYKEYGKIEDDKWTLRTIIELLTGRPTAPNSKLDSLKVKVNELIQSDPKQFLRTITDEYLDMKVLIKKSVEAGIISKRNNLYYLVKDNSPLCNLGEESTLSIASSYLKSPKKQELRFWIESKVNE